jgi:two-component system, LytTR family, response regulator
MINCILIEDMASDAKKISNYISEIPFLSLCEVFNEPLKALQLQRERDIHLLIVDIQMADLSAVNVLRSTASKPELILLSAERQFAVEAYEAGAIDFLLKPISFDRFLSAANKVREIIALKNKQNNADFFFINGAHMVHKLHYSDILYLEGDRDYTKIFVRNASSPHMFLYKLKFFEERLSNNGFIRIHRSFIVPLSRIDNASRKTVTIDGKSIPIGINYREQISELFRSLAL